VPETTSARLRVVRTDEHNSLALEFYVATRESAPLTRD
jgi:hypothetical protein